MANRARARSTWAAGALSERLRRVSSWRSSAVSGRRGSFRWRDRGHLGARGSPHHYTSSHGRRPTSSHSYRCSLRLEVPAGPSAVAKQLKGATRPEMLLLQVADEPAWWGGHDPRTGSPHTDLTCCRASRSRQSRTKQDPLAPARPSTTHPGD